MSEIYERMVAQGDVLFIRVDQAPGGLAPVRPGPRGHVVAHSETGHHHTVRAEPSADGTLGLCEFAPAGDMGGYLTIGPGGGLVEHHRPHDTHATLRLAPGVWRVRRAREHTPEGWRRVED